MLTGDLRSKIDTVWNAFWAGGIANPIEVIEQITYLLFMRGLDEAQALADNKANRTGRPVERAIFPPGKDGIGRGGGVAYADMRWSKLKNRDPATLFAIVAEHVFPFLRAMGEEGSSHATHMKGARFTIPTPALLAKVVDLIADLPMEDRDTKGDLYDYMLSKIASAGQNGQFRTPRHIIDLMVEMTVPTPKDVICDPACGTCGFLFKAAEHLRENHPRLFHDAEARAHFASGGRSPPAEGDHRRASGAGGGDCRGVGRVGGDVVSFKSVALGDVADVNWGDTSVTKASYVPVGFQAYSATGADGCLPYADYDHQAVVLSAIGARCGKTWFAEGQWSCIKNTIRFWSTDKHLDNRFLFWATAHEDFFPKRGAAQPFITIGDASVNRRGAFARRNTSRRERLGRTDEVGLYRVVLTTSFDKSRGI